MECVVASIGGYFVFIMEIDKSKLIDITQPKGGFIFLLLDKDERLLYIGSTDDVNKKAFDFGFEYESIKGFYYKYQDIGEVADKLINRYKPLYNTRYLHHVKRVNAGAYINRKLKENRVRLNSKGIKKACSLISELGMECVEFDNELWIGKTDLDTVVGEILYRLEHGNENI